MDRVVLFTIFGFGLKLNVFEEKWVKFELKVNGKNVIIDICVSVVIWIRVTISKTSRK